MKTKQVFKGEELTRTKVRNQILKVWLQCTKEDKFDWYKDAQSFAKSVSEKDYKKVCGIIAALSPVKRWDNNKLIAEEFYNTGDCGHMQLFKNKAKAIRELETVTDGAILDILNGNKIKSFFLNICYPEAYTEVTIDRHALAIAIGRNLEEEEMKGITKIQYDFFRDCYIWTADKLGVSPLLLQSATWVRWRELKKG